MEVSLNPRRGGDGAECIEHIGPRTVKVSIRVRGGGGAEPCPLNDTNCQKSQSASEAETVPSVLLPWPIACLVSIRVRGGDVAEPRSARSTAPTSLNPRPRRRRRRTRRALRVAQRFVSIRVRGGAELADKYYTDEAGPNPRPRGGGAELASTGMPRSAGLNPRPRRRRCRTALETDGATFHVSIRVRGGGDAEPTRLARRGVGWSQSASEAEVIPNFVFERMRKLLRSQSASAAEVMPNALRDGRLQPRVSIRVRGGGDAELHRTAGAPAGVPSQSASEAEVMPSGWLQAAIFKAMSSNAERRGGVVFLLDRQSQSASEAEVMPSVVEMLPDLPIVSIRVRGEVMRAWRRALRRPRSVSIRVRGGDGAEQAAIDKGFADAVSIRSGAGVEHEVHEIASIIHVSIRVRSGGGAEQEGFLDPEQDASQSASEAEAVPNPGVWLDHPGRRLNPSEAEAAPSDQDRRPAAAYRLNPRPRRRRCRTLLAVFCFVAASQSASEAETVPNERPPHASRLGVSIRVRSGGRCRTFRSPFGGGAESGRSPEERRLQVSIRVRGGGGAEPTLDLTYLPSMSQSASEAEAVPNVMIGTAVPRASLNPHPRRRRC